MHHIFEGKCTDKARWEIFFKAVNQAAFMREYLHIYCSDLTSIAREFMLQFEEWEFELKSNLLN